MYNIKYKKERKEKVREKSLYLLILTGTLLKKQRSVRSLLVRNINYKNFLRNTMKMCLGQGIKVFLCLQPCKTCKCFNPPHPVKPLFTQWPGVMMTFFLLTPFSFLHFLLNNIVGSDSSQWGKDTVTS